MNLSNNAIERICRIFGHLNACEKKGVKFISSNELAKAIGTTAYSIRKDISLLNVSGFTRKGYDVSSLKKDLGQKLNLDKKRKACIVGLGRLGTALLDYEQFQEDGFEIVAGFDVNVNKLERIRTKIDVFSINEMSDIVASRSIELGIITVPAESAQNTADTLIKSGIKGILNFSPISINVPQHIIYMDMDITSTFRCIAAQFMTKKN